MENIKKIFKGIDFATFLIGILKLNILKITQFIKIIKKVFCW